MARDEAASAVRVTPPCPRRQAGETRDPVAKADESDGVRVAARSAGTRPIAGETLGIAAVSSLQSVPLHPTLQP
jgi:hypothetical protein